MAKYPRLRMFAGPNGSGKSTIKSVIGPELLGHYINPDDIERDIRQNGFLDVAVFGTTTTAGEILSFFGQSTLLQKAALTEEGEKLTFSQSKLQFDTVKVNSYFAAVAADFLRRKLLKKQVSFSFETVMSSSDKVALLQTAQGLGYHTYLYYVATEDPAVNILRVQNRVAEGGHPVPEDKIVSRYHRSLDLLMEAVRYTNRAYIFDNTGTEQIWLAEITDGIEMELKTDTMPQWFSQAVLDKISPT
jgi:predicted ABC-type ATPase